MHRLRSRDQQTMTVPVITLLTGVLLTKVKVGERNQLGVSIAVARAAADYLNPTLHATLGGSTLSSSNSMKRRTKNRQDSLC